MFIAFELPEYKNEKKEVIVVSAETAIIIMNSKFDHDNSPAWKGVKAYQAAVN